MNLKVRISLILIFVLLITTLDKVVSADPLQDQLQEYNQSIEEDTYKLGTYEAQAEELRLAIQELDSKIENAMYRQAEIEEEITIINNSIHESNLKIHQYTEEIAKREADKNVFVRSMYKFGELSYIDVIFKSDNVFDAAYNFYNYSALVNSSKKNIEELDTLKKDLISEEEALELNKAELEKANNEAKSIVDDMTAMMNEQQEKLSELNVIHANLSDKIESEKAAVSNITSKLEEQRIQAELERQRQEEARKQAEEEARRQEEARKQAEEEARRQEEANRQENSQSSSENNYESDYVEPNRGSYEESESTNYPVSSSYSASEIVAYASQFQGVPYVWGGTSPSGFDCSGLVQYCYGQFGYYIPRVSQDQQNFGTDVSLSELRTGDLVFWGRPATHVAFYIDGGYILHAPNTGDVVRIQPINLNSITSAKRIIN
ncbi:NlpC/P60 family protein [Clostridium sp. HCS.1]|uniref:C40 family peptidase n=1 Tax=Clostridium sp. HCS.1 TaxID=3238594 RepID=UPI003A0FC308